MTSAATSPSDPATGLQRARGESRIRFAAGPGGTRLDGLYQEGAAKIRLPRLRGEAAEAVLINSAGGLTGGDRFVVSVEVGPAGRATVTTQACERVYRSIGGDAEVAASLTVGAGGRLDWLPQETILFDRGRLRRRLDADLAADAALLLVEAVIFGRMAMGEAVTEGSLRDRWRIRRDGRLLFADDVAVDGGIAEVASHAATLGGAAAMATVLYAGPDPERHLGAVREALGDSGGASAFGGKLVARLTAADGLSLRRRLIPVLALLRGGAPLPRVWQL